MTAPASPPPGFIPYIGITMGERGEGKSVCTLILDDRHRNPNGYVHGGVPYALADTGMAAAAFSTLAEGEWAVTVDVTIAYTAPVREGTLRCETEVVSKGNRLVTLQSRITCDKTLVGTALGTFAIIRPASPPGASGVLSVGRDAAG